MEKERMAICRSCPIFVVDELKCSSIWYVNPETNMGSLLPKPGYIKGCGCYIPTKIKRETNHCPANKW